MEKNCFLAVFLFISMVADISSASSSLSRHRILIGEPTKERSTGKESPVPTLPPPVSTKDANGSDRKPVDDPSKKKTDSTAPVKTPTPDPGPKALTNDTKPGSGRPPTDAGQRKDTNPVPGKTAEEDPNKKQHSKDEPGSESLGGKGKSKTTNSPNGDDKEKNNNDDENNSPNADKGKSKDIEKKNDDVANSPNADKESCEGVIKTCKVKDVVTACIKSIDSGSKEVAILVQNVGDSTLTARISTENSKKDLEIPKHQNKKVSISLDIDKSTNITVNTGNGECELHMDPPVSEGNFFLNLPSYEKLVTPINGAYFLIVTVLIFGGTWACCKVRKRKQRTGGGVPYQELEMGLPESASATAAETAEGWDQGWDDDWDGDNAVKSPGAHRVGSISANGLTSRSLNKDGWENDWDD